MRYLLTVALFSLLVAVWVQETEAQGGQGSKLGAVMVTTAKDAMNKTMPQMKVDSFVKVPSCLLFTFASFTSLSPNLLSMNSSLVFPLYMSMCV